MKDNYINYNYTSPGVGTSVVKFDKPRLALVNGHIEEVYGILLITSYRNIKDKSTPEVETYRRPLVGETYKPTSLIHENGERAFILLPQDKQLDEKTLKPLVEAASTHSSVTCFLENCTDYGLKFTPSKLELKVYIDYNEKWKTLLLISEAFTLTYDNVDRNRLDDMSPADFFELFDLKKFVKVPFVFESVLYPSEKDNSLASWLTRWMGRLEKGELLYKENNLNVCNDGEYTYTEDLGKIPMTTSEFQKKFPEFRQF